MLLYVTSGKAEGDCEPPGIPAERSLVVWQLLWRRLQYWDRSGFSVRGECMWLRVGYMLCRVIRYIKGTNACVGDCKYLPVWQKQVQPQRIKESSIMSPTRLNHLPEKQWLTRRFTQLQVPKPPYAKQNKLLFVYYRGVNMCLWKVNRQSLFGYTSLIIYSNLNRLFWLVKSFPMILSWCYRLLLMIPPQAQTN